MMFLMWFPLCLCFVVVHWSSTCGFIVFFILENFQPLCLQIFSQTFSSWYTISHMLDDVIQSQRFIKSSLLSLWQSFGYLKCFFFIFAGLFFYNAKSVIYPTSEIFLSDSILLCSRLFSSFLYFYLSLCCVQFFYLNIWVSFNG